MNTKIVSFFLISLLLLSVVAIGFFILIPGDETQEMKQEPETPVPESRESTSSEFEDVTSSGVSEVDGVRIHTFTAKIQNSTTDDRQAVWLFFPETEKDVPLVVMVQGGAGDGADFVKSDRADVPPEAQILASNGLVVIAYSALGVGESEGEQNYHGFDDQDGLAAIVQAGKQLKGVDESRVGLASFSYGVTAAVGVLARYPELGISFYSDWEGPSSRQYTTIGCGTPSTHEQAQRESTSPASKPCDDDDFWKEREAGEMMKDVEGLQYYWRIQEKDDHVQSTYGHTIEMLEAAKAAGIPWFRVNNGEVNRVYTQNILPVMANGDPIQYALANILEMIEMLK